MNKTIATGGLVLLAAFGLLFWSSSQGAARTYFNGTEVACLSNGHQSIETHIHPQLTIVVDEESEIIPANIGIVGSCMSEVHTHDSSGTIHIETDDRERLDGLNLSHFFAVWGENIEREGYSLEIVKDGKVFNSISDVSFEDHSLIELRYTSVTEEEQG